MADEKTYERIGRLLYGVQRFGGPERLLALQDDPAVPPELAACGRALAERHMAIMKGSGAGAAGLTETEVDDILRGTAELHARLAQGLG
jgi:hypothetical protein